MRLSSSLVLGRSGCLVSAFLTAGLAASSAQADIINVGPSDSYDKIEAAQAGDEVLIAPGTYHFRVSLENQGTAAQPIVIRAADPANPPVWDLSGQATGDWPGSYTAGDKGRGCWQVRGDYYEIRGIHFTGCRDHSGSALRAVNVGSLTVQDCLFENSTNGVTGTADPYIIEYSEFRNNGVPFEPGDNPSHNLYVFGGTLVLRYNYFHDSGDGQNFHVRARDALLEYNWFSRPGSYPGDLMSCEYLCGGTGSNPITQRMLLRGNVIVQNTPVNLSQIIALYKDGGASSDDTGDVTRMELTMVYNTIIGTPVSAGKTQRLVNLANGSVDTHAVLSNNVLYHLKNAAEPQNPGASNWSLAGNNNWASTGTGIGALTGTVFGDDPGFENVGAGDYRPASASPLRNAAGPLTIPVPDREYYQNEAFPCHYQLRASTKDIGAFEYGTQGTIYGPDDQADGGAGAAGAGGSGVGGAGGTSVGGAGGASVGGAAGTGGTSTGGAAGTGGASTGGAAGQGGGTSGAGGLAGSGGTAKGGSGGKAGSSDAGLEAGTKDASNADSGADAGIAATGGGDDGGCGCTAAGRAGSGELWALLSASWLGLALTRRRRREPSTGRS